jgi:hypothetical protein
MEVFERKPVGGFVAAIEGAAEIVESARQRPLCFNQPRKRPFHRDRMSRLRSGRQGRFL